MNINDCPVKHLSLHTRLKQAVEAGVCERKSIFRPGLGKGTCVTYQGNQLVVRSRVRGQPKFKNGVPQGLFFKEPHDVAYDAVTDTLIAWAPTL